MGLTPRQERFCLEYVVDMNGTQAAIRAGYSFDAAKEQACRLLTKANIKDYIATLKAQKEKELAVDASWVLRNLIDLFKKTSAAEEVTDKDGNGTGVWKFDGPTSTRILENIGKHVGFFPDSKLKLEGDVKHEHAGTVAHEHKLSEDLESLTDAFVSAACREKKSDLCEDGSTESVDTGLHQNGDDKETD